MGRPFFGRLRLWTLAGTFPVPYILENQPMRSGLWPLAAAALLGTVHALNVRVNSTKLPPLASTASPAHPLPPFVCNETSRNDRCPVIIQCPDKDHRLPTNLWVNTSSRIGWWCQDYKPGFICCASNWTAPPTPAQHEVVGVANFLTHVSAKAAPTALTCEDCGVEIHLTTRV